MDLMVCITLCVILMCLSLSALVCVHYCDCLGVIFCTFCMLILFFWLKSNTILLLKQIFRHAAWSIFSPLKQISYKHNLTLLTNLNSLNTLIFRWMILISQQCACVIPRYTAVNISQQNVSRFHKRLWPFSDFCNLLLLGSKGDFKEGGRCLLLPCLQKHCKWFRIRTAANCLNCQSK